MTLTTQNLTIEIAPTFFYARRGGHEVFVNRDLAFSFWEFDKLRSDAGIELWGFGLRCVLNWPAQRAAM